MTFGLLHGLVWFPVVLSLIGPTRNFSKDEPLEKSTNKSISEITGAPRSTIEMEKPSRDQLLGELSTPVHPSLRAPRKVLTKVLSHSLMDGDEEDGEEFEVEATKGEITQLHSEREKERT